MIHDVNPCQTACSPHVCVGFPIGSLIFFPSVQEHECLGQLDTMCWSVCVLWWPGLAIAPCSAHTSYILMLLFLLDTVKTNVPNCNRNSCKCAFSQRIVLRPAVSLLSCGHLLGGVSGLTVMGLSDSVLSCLLFIAGWCYLLDPLCVCMCVYAHIYTHIHISIHVWEWGVAAPLLVCVWPSVGL